MMNHKTPEEIEAAGYLPLTDEDVLTNSPAYQERLKNHLPVFAPKVKVGDWVYNPISRENQKIVRITWDDGGPCWNSGWRYNQPGYSTMDPWNAPSVKAPFVEYVTDNGWSYRADRSYIGTPPAAM